MSRRFLAALMAGSIGVTACGGDDDKPSGSGGSGGSAGQAGAGGTAGTGGSAGSAGSAGDGGAPADGTPPSFAGLDVAMSTGETSVELSWPSATDDTTPEPRIAYRVYEANAAGAHDFSAPRLKTPAGARRAVLSDLDPAKDYFFVVRAVDEAGNEDGNTVEKTATTPDTSPPKFPGISRVLTPTSRSLLVEWRPGKDAAFGANLTYNVYVATSKGGQSFAAPTATVSGQTSVLLSSGINPESQYFVVVRAADPLGNEDANTKEIQVTTPEGRPPTFGGARLAVARGRDAVLYWTPGNDSNGTEQANLVYDVYASTTAGGHDFTKAPFDTSKPGVAQHVVRGLAPGTKHFFVVRARDAAGNRDQNTVEVNTTVGGATDTTAPTFAGIQSATATSPSTIVGSWNAASDAGTPAKSIVYDVYVSSNAGGQDFAAPTLSTAPGATSVTLTGLNPGASRFIVVRARDQAGNALPLTMEATATTPPNPTPSDTTAPVFGGAPAAINVPNSPGTLEVSWGPATDDTWPDTDVRYHVCVQREQQFCLGAEFDRHIAGTTAFGATSFDVAGLVPRTSYFVHVRAEDRSGNLETGNNFVRQITATSFFSDVQPILVDRCSSCHDYYKGVTQIVNVGSGYILPGVGTLKLVEPGVPERSYLYRKINPANYTGAPFSPATPNTFTGSQEPRTGDGLPTFDVLTGAEDGAIRDWILQGAFGA